jgi:hypothetical protein
MMPLLGMLSRAAREKSGGVPCSFWYADAQMRVHRSVFGRAVIKVNEPITPSRVTYDDASGMTVYDYVFVLVGVLFVHNS